MAAKLGISRFEPDTGEPLAPGHGALAFVAARKPEEYGNPRCFRKTVKNLRKAGYKILCSVDAGTPAQFGCVDEPDFLDRYDIDFLHLDNGYSENRLQSLARTLPVVLSTSSFQAEDKELLLALNPDLLFIHNCYPKEDTGLDLDTFKRFCGNVPLDHLAVFIPGDERLLGPLHEGLVTLEDDRGKPPYTAFVRFQEMGIRHILVADPGLSRFQRSLIEQARQGIYPVPCHLDKTDLYGRVFTIRRDSPAGLWRLQESCGPDEAAAGIEPFQSGWPRYRGDICQDNEEFGCFSGEITVIGRNLPAKSRINTVGRIDPDYLPLLDFIGNGRRIILVKECE